MVRSGMQTAPGSAGGLRGTIRLSVVAVLKKPPQSRGLIMFAISNMSEAISTLFRGCGQVSTVTAAIGLMWSFDLNGNRAAIVVQFAGRIINAQVKRAARGRFEHGVEPNHDRISELGVRSGGTLVARIDRTEQD